MTNNDTVSNKIFWRGFWSTIFFLLFIYLIALFNLSDNKKVSLSEDGKHLVLSNEIVELWKNKLPSVFGTITEEFQVKAKGEIEAKIDEKIDAIFAPVYEQIPKFAEFHYSVTGEYTEIVAALAGQMGNQVQDILFKEVGFDGNLQKGLTEISHFSLDKISDSSAKINQDMKNKMELGDDDMNVLTKTLQLTTQDIRNRYTNLGYNTIRGAGVAMGLSATGTVLAKTMGKKLATKIAAKTAIKTTAKGASILGGAGAGVATCAVGGPLASGLCGFVGGVLTWIAVDKFIVEIDEHFNRDDFEKELRDMVDEQKQEIKKGLKDSYSTLITTFMEERKDKLKSITPAELVAK